VSTTNVPTIAFGGKVFTCPFADVMPPLAPDEQADLRESIRVRGVQDAVIVTDEDEVLDGHTRLSIAVELGLDDVPFDVRAGLTADEKRDLAEVLNLHRRHLSQKQKRDLIARRLKADPVKSDRSIAEAVKVSDKTVGSVRRDLERRAEFPHAAKRTDASGRKQAATKPKVAPVPSHSGGPAPVVPPDDEPDEESDDEERQRVQKQKGKAMAAAAEAINCLMKIRRDNPGRARGHELVADWIEANGTTQEVPAPGGAAPDRAALSSALDQADRAVTGIKRMINKKSDRTPENTAEVIRRLEAALKYLKSQ
jgi:ParB-like nuclease domain